MFSYCIKDKSQSFQLPLLEIQLSTHDIVLNPSELLKITSAKNQIDKYRFSKQWEKMKKITNPYELVYVNDRYSTRPTADCSGGAATINEASSSKSNIEHSSRCLSVPIRSVANIEPISRSFFKLHEIINVFLKDIIIPCKSELDIHEIKEKYKPIRTLHLCESPGGFIAATRYNRNYHPNDQLFAISIRPTNKNVPSWSKSRNFLKANPQIRILYGADDTGDIYNPENIKSLGLELGGNHTCDLITGDGGFDFSNEFNHQETNMSRLIFAQILAALINQKEGGTLVLKIFDLNCLITYNMIYILQCYYEEVHIYKPCISRIANSEKYLVCLNYKRIPFLIWTNLMSILYGWRPNIVSIFAENTLASIYIKKINIEIVCGQIEYINKTIKLIQSPPSREWLLQNTTLQIGIARDWCEKFGIPIC